MSVINTEMYEALLLAQVPEDKARAAAAEVARSTDFASKSDLLEIGVQLQAAMEGRFAEMDKRFAEMGKRFAEVGKRFAEVDKRFAEVGKRFAEVDRRFAEMDRRFADIEKSLAVLKFAVFSGGSIILALLIKLVFFP